MKTKQAIMIIYGIYAIAFGVAGLWVFEMVVPGIAWMFVGISGIAAFMTLAVWRLK